MYKYFIPLFFVLTSCGNSYKADYEVKTELQLIDTLQNRLKTVKSWLDYLPLSEIQERKDIIKHNYEYCDSRYRELGKVVDPETSQLMDEYKNYGKLYGRAADSFKPIVMEMEELLIQLKTLKESAHSKDYQKKTFLKYFRQEKEAVEKLYDFAQTVLLSVKETDLAFERAQDKVEKLAESLKK
jgi:hypothetical protein